MLRQILILHPLYSSVVEEIITRMNEIPSGEDINAILNSPGGSVFSGWTLAAAIMEFPGKVHFKIRGHAASMAPFLALLGDTSEALDVTMFMLHRADSWDPSEEEKKTLAIINAAMHKKMKAKIDDAKLKEITGFYLKDIFEAETQTDVWLTAKQAKEIGLIDKVVKLERKEMKAEMDSFAAYFSTENKKEKRAPRTSGDKPDNNPKIVKMDINKFKTDHPEVYSAVIALGATQEKTRVKAWMAFNAIAPKEVAAAIAGCDEVDSAVIAEMSVKAISGLKKEELETEGAGAVETNPVGIEKSAEQKNLDAFQEKVNAKLGLQKDAE